MQIITDYHKDLPTMSQAVADKIRLIAMANIAKKGFFTLVLTGGRTPGLLYKNLAKPCPDKKIDWHKTHIFWGDERCVPPDHDASNFKLAKDTLLNHIDIPNANIHRMPGELEDHKAAAQKYEKEIISFFSDPDKNMNLPCFDLILLGMGEDGHIASIFPEYICEPNKLITTTYPKNNTPTLHRLSMTLKLINKAECIIMLISGAKKKKIFAEIKNDQVNSTKKYPAAALAPSAKLFWEIV